jgi:hypothetical protein
MRNDEELLNIVANGIAEILKQNKDKCVNRLEGFTIVPIWAAELDIDKLPAGSLALTEEAKNNYAGGDAIGQMLRVQQAMYNMLYKYQEKSLVEVYNSAVGLSEQLKQMQEGTEKADKAVADTNNVINKGDKVCKKKPKAVEKENPEAGNVKKQ